MSLNVDREKQMTDIFQSWKGRNYRGLMKIDFILLDLDHVVKNSDETIDQMGMNHLENLDTFAREPILLFHQEALPVLTAQYKTSPAAALSPQTLEFSLTEKDTDGKERATPIYSMNLMEFTVNGTPTLFISEIQRYTNEKRSTVERMRVLYPDDYDAFTAMSKKIKKVKKKLDAPFSLICSVTALALAKAKGYTQVALAPDSVHNDMKSMVVGTSKRPLHLYANTANTLGLRRDNKIGNWWTLQDSSPITIPQQNYAALSPSLQGIGQRAYSGFLQRIYPQRGR